MMKQVLSPFLLLLFLFQLCSKTSGQSSPSGPADIAAVLGQADSAFSDLKPGTLNSFSDQQKAALTQFHVVPTFLTVSQFQTVSNPLHTQAGENTVEFPLNVVGNGTQVLLSQGILGPQAPAPAPAPLPPKPKKATPLNSAAPSKSTTVSVDSSGAGGLPHYAPTAVSIGVAVLAALSLIPMN
ncbi:Fasciclin-like arabinogalactan protein 11 [Vitis vinifera]|uniref:Fasciclin-like arabinogalactan protein 11 n=1 Tax=Vitis vinifera TaxID=29760 RepID=A0A438H721_VITVI|nr:Fasciclin-like arabinogalactan protein 11 [Vitis vinifera]